MRALFLHLGLLLLIVGVFDHACGDTRMIGWET